MGQSNLFLHFPLTGPSIPVTHCSCPPACLLKQKLDLPLFFVCVTQMPVWAVSILFGDKPAKCRILSFMGGGSRQA